MAAANGVALRVLNYMCMYTNTKGAYVHGANNNVAGNACSNAVFISLTEQYRSEGQFPKFYVIVWCLNFTVPLRDVVKKK